MLVYLVGTLIHLNLELLDIIAASIELTHCYSLIHDDLPAMDDDDLRRGKPSCHKAFDEATAILVGDGMQALAIDVLLSHLSSQVESSTIVAITHELINASGVSGMVSGQSLDLTELNNPLLTEEQLKTIHQLKTGKLILACIKMVLAASDSVSAEEQQALEAYANHIGLVFQMQDDYLDRYAPKDILGKSRSSDLANNKMTFAALYSKDQLRAQIAEHYDHALDVLNLFGGDAVQLLEFTRGLQHRS